MSHDQSAYGLWFLVAINSAIFLLEELELGAWRFEGALRQEWQDARAQGRVDTEPRSWGG